MATTLSVKTSDGINWHVEQQGSGPHLILIPSGEGDCESFSKGAKILSATFTVTTFDMPGMVRSPCPPEQIQNVDAPLMAKQINGLLDELHIEKATIFGSSSGSWAAFGLAAYYPERIQSIIVHEVPLVIFPSLFELLKLDDKGIVDNCRPLFENFFNEDAAAWNGIGKEYHERLEKNYVTWIRGYAATKNPFPLTNEEMKRRPVTWTIGALNQIGVWFNNIKKAHELGIEMELLNSKHFPYVSVPEEWAEHVKKSALKYL
ncbi:hypothetical protein G7Y89_g7761 [Cudoniella acicularis]|uniref:AB hydrolase-1 domain-containing protein n=1 Tax=Cudoniella acicularis TaxID=354080 RepID=A0A8H4RHU5_9HELO|nr:hypothetical protein G7Y89_g7761 [Cudoniella acicularis]